MTTTAEDTTPCGVCGGSKKEHEAASIHHVWVPDGGQLVSKEAAAKKAAQSRGPQPVVVRPNLGGDEVAKRLTEVLLQKGLLSSAEGLYIAGIGDKPPSLQPSGFKDPARPW